MHNLNSEQVLYTCSKNVHILCPLPSLILKIVGHAFPEYRRHNRFKKCYLPDGESKLVDGCYEKMKIYPMQEIV